jgi:hypothetical protein
VTATGWTPVRPFLALDAHLQMIATLIATFRTLPVDANVLAASGWRPLADRGSTVLSAGLLLIQMMVAESGSVLRAAVRRWGRGDGKGGGGAGSGALNPARSTPHPITD